MTPPHTAHLTLRQQTDIPSSPFSSQRATKCWLSKYVNFCSTCLSLQPLCIDRNGQSFIMFRRGQHCRQHFANTPLHLLVLSQPRLCYFWYIEHEGSPPPTPSYIFISLRVQRQMLASVRFCGTRIVSQIKLRITAKVFIHLHNLWIIHVSAYRNLVSAECSVEDTRADREVRLPYLLKINSNIYFQNQIHNMKA
jgi:hypothetical protein